MQGQQNIRNLGFNCAIEKEPKHYINELIIDTENAICYLDSKIQKHLQISGNQKN